MVAGGAATYDHLITAHGAGLGQRRIGCGHGGIHAARAGYGCDTGGDCRGVGISCRFHGRGGQDRPYPLRQGASVFQVLVGQVNGKKRRLQSAHHAFATQPLGQRSDFLHHGLGSGNAQLVADQVQAIDFQEQ